MGRVLLDVSGFRASLVVTDWVVVAGIDFVVLGCGAEYCITL
jgi:hypothetical protein